MKFIDLFSGIGGFRYAMEKEGHECVWSCEIDDYARQVYRKHWEEPEASDIREVQPEDIPEHDIICGGFPCFLKNQKVITEKGVKKIYEIEEDEKVLTHKGRFKNVDKTFKREYEGNFIKLNTHYNYEEILCTPEHPLYISDKKGNKEWVEAKNIEIRGKKKYLGIPLNKESKELPTFKYEFGLNQHKTEVKELDLASEDFWWCIGYYIAEGWYEKRRKRNGEWKPSQRVILSVNEEETDYVLNKFNKVFDCVNLAEERTANKIHIINKGLHSFVKKLGDDASEKRVPPEVYKLPKETLKEFLEGYIYGDGYENKEEEISITTISKKLAKELQYLFTITYEVGVGFHKVETTDKTKIEERTVNQKDYYRLSFRPYLDESKYFFKKDGYIWLKIKETDKNVETKKSKFVYNLRVEGDKTYNARGISVHNCQSFSIAGDRKGFEDTRGTLFHEICRISRVQRPSWLLLENVQGLLSTQNRKAFRVVLESLDDIGYDVTWQVLNSKNFGVPQNRPRVFIIGGLRAEGRSPWKILPVPGGERTPHREDGESRREQQGVQSEVCTTLTEGYHRLRANGETYIEEGIKKEIDAGFQKTVYNPNGISPAVREGHGDVIRILDSQYQGKVREYDEYTPAVTSHETGGWEDIKVMEKIKDSPTLAEIKFELGCYEDTLVLDDYNSNIKYDGIVPAVRPTNSVDAPRNASKIIEIGNIYPSGGQNGQVISPYGISPAIRCGGSPKKENSGLGSINAPKVALKDKKTNNLEELTSDMSQGYRVYDSKGISKTLAGKAGGLGAKTGLYLEGKKDNMKIRKLMPVECERLQGFPDGWTETGLDQEGNEVEISDTQRYKLIGNAVTTNVVEFLAKRFENVE